MLFSWHTACIVIHAYQPVTLKEPIMKLNTYHIEITDTFGGEANYTWKREYRVHAKSIRGAVQVLSRHYCAGWKVNYTFSDNARYDMQGACVCAFVQYVDDGESIFNDVPFIN